MNGIKCTIQIPRYKDGTQKTMWNLIVNKEIPPTRLNRYCCVELKETSTPNRFIAVGVRASESNGRKGRNVFATRGKTKYGAYYYYYSHIKEQFDNAENIRKELNLNPNDADVYDCKFIERAKQNQELICNPIYDWTDKDVWEYINNRGLPHNPLYDRGFCRVGCIGCPMSTRRMMELDMYPKIKQAYKNAFKKMIAKRESKGKIDKSGRWSDEEGLYQWWVEDKNIPGQLEFDLEGNINEHKA